jgi:hypothetical protein
MKNIAEQEQEKPAENCEDFRDYDEDEKILKGNTHQLSRLTGFCLGLFVNPFLDRLLISY